MSRLLLHIGSPKAGSSAIQSSLLLAAPDLRRDHGLVVCPPNPYGRALPSGFLAACHLAPEALPRYLAVRRRKNQDQFERDVRAYRQTLRDVCRLGRPLGQLRWRRPLLRLWRDLQPARDRSLVLSTEYLWRYPIDAIQRMRAHFEGLGVREFRVVAYVREPVAAYGSFLQQWLRLSDDLERYNPWTWHYRLRENLEAWGQVFPGDELVVRPFRREQLCGGSVVSDFYVQLSDWLGETVSGPEPEGVNESLSCEALFLVQQLLATVDPERRLQLDWVQGMGRFRRLLRQVAQSLPCHKVAIQPWVRRLVWEQHAADLAWLQQHHAVAFEPPDAAFLSVPLPDPQQGFALSDLLVPPQDPELLDVLARRQLEALLREGLA